MPLILRTLYARLAVGLILLLFAIGLFYVLVNTSLIEQQRHQISQQLHRDLAHDLVMDRNLVREGRLNEEALKQTFHDYMVINPSIEIYLLDLNGKILSFSADPGKVKRKHVSLVPIQGFLMEQEFPILGDDPRSHDRQKAFSVTPIPSAEQAEGYLYVVLQGEEYDAVNAAVREGEIMRLGLFALLMSLILGVLAGLGIFYGLTRRLRELAQRMDRFRSSDFSQFTPVVDGANRSADEIAQLTHTFEQMAARIVTQISALETKDHQRRELVAQVSHDLRTPLASLHGYLETLVIKQADLTPAAQQEYLSIALSHSERLAKLVNSLFELAKLDAKEDLSHQEPFMLAELIQDVVQKYTLPAEAKDLQLFTQCRDGAVFVMGDIGLIERVFENLIENAMAHTSAGDTLTLATECEQDSVLVTVADSGKGIDAEDVPHIFDRFYQGGGTQSDGEHAGLGLAIVKRILALHGSAIEVVSSPQGTKFSFTLARADIGA